MVLDTHKYTDAEDVLLDTMIFCAQLNIQRKLVSNENLGLNKAFNIVGSYQTASAKVRAVQRGVLMNIDQLII